MGDQSLTRSGPVPEAICPAARPSATTRVAPACRGRRAPGLTKPPAVVAAPCVSAEARPLASPGGARRGRGSLNWAPRGRRGTRHRSRGLRGAAATSRSLRNSA